MNRTDISRILLEYEKLQKKVIEVNLKLYESNIDREWYPISARDVSSVDKIEIDEIEAWIYDTTWGWGNSQHEISTVIPIDWLLLSDEDLMKAAKSAKVERDEESRKKQVERDRLLKEDTEKREREQYEKLKAKFKE